MVTPTEPEWMEPARQAITSNIASIRNRIAIWEGQGRKVSTKSVLNLIENDLLGHGCVIGVFDVRRGQVDAAWWETE